MPTREDIRFGGLALARCWLSQRQLHKAVRKVERLEHIGGSRPIAQVLIEMDLLDGKQVRDLLDEMRLVLSRCSRCRMEGYAAAGAERDAWRCGACGGALVAIDVAGPDRAGIAGRSRASRRTEGRRDGKRVSVSVGDSRSVPPVPDDPELAELERIVGDETASISHGGNTTLTSAFASARPGLFSGDRRLWILVGLIAVLLLMLLFAYLKYRGINEAPGGAGLGPGRAPSLTEE